jgi:EAL domain-containing protein (putative c-di-GMP-specific phosphodiesterase class I)/GGDEF domain-containing protein
MDRPFSVSPDIFTDSVTRLPHPLVLMPHLEKRLRQDGSLGLVVVSVDGLDPIEQIHGQEAYDRILRGVSDILFSLQGKIIRDDDLLAMSEVGGSAFLIFLGEQRQKERPETLQKEDVTRLAERIYDHLFPQLSSLFYTYTKAQPKLAIGYSMVVNNPLIRVRRLIHRLIDEARDMARFKRPLSILRHKEALQKIILSENISTVFQPIFHIGSGSVLGYEALTRGPGGTIFESPCNLFAAAAEVGLSFELDRLCRKRAIQQASVLPGGAKIFINTLPNTMHDPALSGNDLRELLESTGKPAADFVFEINERMAIENFDVFRAAIQPYLDIGMSIAVDDAGTGYSSLEAIVELRPRYLKFDLAFVRGITKNPVKQEMLRMMTLLASKIDSVVIAEGVEEIEEAELLATLNVPYAQGFYFARPAPPHELINPKETAAPYPPL